jgi:arsenite methyltransferase
MQEKPDYGIDAPGVIRNLLLGGVALGAVAFFFPRVTIAQVTFELNPGFYYTAVWCIVPGILMLVYAKAGKFRHRDRMLAKVSWTGAEQVLDVGTGRGLLLIGSAKRLTNGHATGIDIWNAEDLSGNAPEAVVRNIELENVRAKTTVKSEDARKMSFADASFDVVLSNLCLHNIYQREGRAEACREIVRVLKRGGMAVLSDFRHTREYAKTLRQAGLSVEMCALNWADTFPPLRILQARKP